MLNSHSNNRFSVSMFFCLRYAVGTLVHTVPELGVEAAQHVLWRLAIPSFSSLDS